MLIYTPVFFIKETKFYLKLKTIYKMGQVRNIVNLGEFVVSIVLDLMKK